MSGTLHLGADAKRPNPGYLKLLEEFGYPTLLAEKALMAVKNESLNHAIEWLDKNRDAEDTFQQWNPRPQINLGQPSQ